MKNLKNYCLYTVLFVPVICITIAMIAVVAMPDSDNMLCRVLLGIGISGCFVLDPAILVNME